jgi:lysine/arginine/ornithine transport system substrate-binding protein
MKIILNILSIILIAAVTAYIVSHASNKNSGINNNILQTAFDRIIKTNTIRCGYAVATPWFMADPNTKKLSGVGYDVTNAVAAKMGVKVDWVEETGWGIAEQGLTAGRYDMLCGSVCIDPHRARAATFSTPFLHIPILAVVRANDPKFTNATLDDLNKPDVRFGVKNGHVFEYTANERFPKGEKIYANDLSDDTEFFLMLSSNKIDVAFSGQETVDLYLKKHPGSIRSLPQAARYCNGAFMLPLGDIKLKLMVDNAIGEINSSSQIQNILTKYMKFDPRYVLAPAMLFREEK